MAVNRAVTGEYPSRNQGFVTETAPPARPVSRYEIDASEGKRLSASRVLLRAEPVPSSYRSKGWLRVPPGPPG